MRNYPFSSFLFISCFAACTIEPPENPIPQPGLIPALIAETPDLHHFEEAMELAELEDELASDGPFTLLGPSNSAFENYLEEHEEWQVLEDIPKNALRELLRYHVLSGEALSNDLTMTDELTSVLDKKVYVTEIGAQITFNGQASVVTADIEAENGVIHVINALLMPLEGSPFDED